MLLSFLNTFAVKHLCVCSWSSKVKQTNFYVMCNPYVTAAEVRDISDTNVPVTVIL